MKGLSNGSEQAIWINNSNNENENENSVLTNSFNGNNWQGNTTFISKKSGYKFKDLSFSVNDSNASICWVSTHYNDDGTFLNNLNVKYWDSKTGTWFDDNSVINNDDSTSNIKEPKIVVTKNGIEVLAYYNTPIFTDDSASSSKKELVFLLKDLKNKNSEWKNYHFISDDNVIVWQSDLAVNDNTIYLLTQETDTILGNNYIPKNGVRFGSLASGLVLRTWDVNDDLTITKVDEPGTPVSVAENVTKDVLLRQNYPNPFSTFTTIEYFIPRYCLAKLEVFDMLGNKISTLVGDYLQEGTYQTSFYAGNLESGLYYYKLSANGFTDVKIMLIDK